MRKISIGAILLGGAVDILSSTLLGLPFAFFALSSVDLSHVPHAEMSAATAAAIQGNVPMFTAQILAGLLGSVLGGAVAAGLAGRNELLNGCLSSFLCISLGAVVLVTGANHLPLWVDILMLPASPAMGMLGGAIVRLSRNRRPALA